MRKSIQWSRIACSDGKVVKEGQGVERNKLYETKLLIDTETTPKMYISMSNCRRLLGRKIFLLFMMELVQNIF